MTDYAALLDQGKRLLLAGKPAEAKSCLFQLVSQASNNCDAIHLLAIACFESGDIAQALPLFKRLIALAPNRREFWSDYVVALSRLPDQPGEMLSTAEQAVRRFPNLVKVWHAVANHFDQQADWPRLRLVLEQAIQALPDNVDFQMRLGRCYRKLGELDKAVAVLATALTKDPQHIPSLRLYGEVLNEQGKFKQACECWERSLAIDAHDAYALTQLLVGRRRCCDWRGFDELAQRLRGESEARLQAGNPPAESSLVSVCVFMDNAYQFKVAKAWAARRWPNPAPQHTAGEPSHLKSHPRRITVGYVTDELRDHPTGLLMYDYFQLHDRDRFRTIVYFDHRPDERDDVFRHIAATCGESRQVAGQDDQTLAELVRRDGVDILVDLKGWRDGNRLSVLALRPAPIGVNYLAFPGTTGTPFVDYILVDECVVPPQQAESFAEKPAYLGRCYQINPVSQPVYDQLRAEAGSRRDHGLPDEALVLVSFNQAYKLDPHMMALWLDIMHRAEDTVLWLLAMNEDCRMNLRQMAEEHGVDARRLIFAPWADHRPHLARLTHGDIGVDTRIYNGHTTTSESLWCRVPVVTLIGQHFASRVSASILREVGLAELIATDLDAYRDLVLRLIHETTHREAIRNRLTAEHLRATLFNTSDFVRRVEDLFEQMHDLHHRGLPPQMLECRF